MNPPRNQRRPLIAISADLSENRPQVGQEPILFLPQRYYHAVQQTDGIALIVPPIASRSTLSAILQRLDGLLISGGNFDIHPSYYGEKPISALGVTKESRTEFELELIELALNQDLPLLGICGGAQAINVALGGTLYQDIVTQLPNAGKHELRRVKHGGSHPVEIRSGTRLHRILQRRALEVNTSHHQAIKAVGRGLVVNATAEDGVIEGIESTSHRFVLGVQWHPEVSALADRYQRRIFSSFISAAKYSVRRI